MARTWRNERTDKRVKKQHAQHHGQEGTKRPRMNEFAQQWYEDHGYTVTHRERALQEVCDE